MPQLGSFEKLDVLELISQATTKCERVQSSNFLMEKNIVFVENHKWL